MNNVESEPVLERLADRVDRLHRSMLSNGILCKTPRQITDLFHSDDQRAARIALDSMLRDGGEYKLDSQGRVVYAWER
jgi:hypothetical protein